MITHDELNFIGAKWLKKHSQNVLVPNCNEIAIDLSTATKTGEKPDVLGWCSCCSVLIETKVSRSDFLADKKKNFRTREDFGVGDFRYYLVPEGLIKENEIPDNWGLLYYSEEGIEIIKKSRKMDSNLDSERTILLSIMRRRKKKLATAGRSS